MEIRANYDMNFDFRNTINQSPVQEQYTAENEKEPESTATLNHNAAPQSLGKLCSDVGNSNSVEWRSAEFADGLGSSHDKQPAFTLQSSDKRHRTLFDTRESKEHLSSVLNGGLGDTRQLQIIDSYLNSNRDTRHRDLKEQNAISNKVKAKGDAIIERLYKDF